MLCRGDISQVIGAVVVTRVVCSTRWPSSITTRQFVRYRQSKTVWRERVILAVAIGHVGKEYAIAGGIIDMQILRSYIALAHAVRADGGVEMPGYAIRLIEVNFK